MSPVECRVNVRREPSSGRWRAELVTPPGETLGDVIVGRFDSMPEAVRTGITAARFVAAGVPWRAEQ
jgi:hypothetical protein